MYKEIFETIKSYNNIVIARHVGVDPDAMASQMGLKRSIELTFPDKKVFAIGNGSVKFNFLGRLDTNVDFDSLDKILLIVTDTPDRKRIDMEGLNSYEKSMKIDHHPFMEKFCDIECIEDNKSSASEVVYNIIKNTDLVLNQEVAEILFAGIVADTNRFLFNNTKAETFKVASDMLADFDINISKVYNNLYRRPLAEVKFFGYMISSMEVTKNKLGFIKIDNKALEEYNVDAATTGNQINEFNNIDELLIWLSATEDIKNGFIRVSVRSNGPVVNKLLEGYGGGGHPLASGVKLKTFEEVDKLIKDLDNLCQGYIESSDEL